MTGPVELRFTLNARLNPDASTSTTIVVLVQDENDAAEAGIRAQQLTKAFIDAYVAEDTTPG